MNISRWVLALVLGFSLVSLGRAQETPVTVQKVKHLTIQPGSRVVVESPTAEPASKGCKNGICGWLGRTFGPRCWGHHDEPVTGNCHSEMVFMFGSSRAYFGEPCRPIPPGAYGPGGYNCAPYCHLPGTSSCQCGPNGCK